MCFGDKSERRAPVGGPMAVRREKAEAPPPLSVFLSSYDIDPEIVSCHDACLLPPTRPAT